MEKGLANRELMRNAEKASLDTEEGRAWRLIEGVTLAHGRLGRPAPLPCPHFPWQTLKTLRQVEVINFGDCLVRSKGAVAIADAVRGGLPKLKELNLSFCEIKRDAALAVAEAVADKAELEKLDLNGNTLGEEGCEQLQEVLDGFNMARVLASLSDDEGEDDEDEDEDEEGEEEEEEEEEDEDEEEEEDEDEDEPQQRGQGEESPTLSRKILDPNSGVSSLSLARITVLVS